MSAEKKPASTGTFTHQDLLKDNSINVADLPAKTQELIKKFALLDDADSQDAMDLKIYSQVDDFLDAKKAAAKDAAIKTKHAEAKAKKGIDVSKADTTKTPEQLAAEKAKEDAAAPKTRSLFDVAFGRK